MLSTVPSTSQLTETDVLAAIAPDGGRVSGGSGVADTADTAVRIMLAAADAFAEHGFAATTTRDIASRAGLSPAGVYVHFASKEILLFELSRRGHLRARDLLVAAAADAGSPTEALRAIIGGFSRWHAEHHQLGRIVQFEFRHLSAPHQAEVVDLRKEIDHVVAEVLRAGVGTGEFDVDDVRTTAIALLSMAVDVARWYVPGSRRTPEAIGATYGELAVRLARAAH